MIYEFREGRSLPVDAQTIGEQLEIIAEANDGETTPKAVVDHSRPDDAPLHPIFEWRNPIAAELYREDQARRVIRSVQTVTVPQDGGEPVRCIAYVSVGSPVPGGARYVTTAEAMSDDELRKRVLEDALRAIRSLKARYGHLRELARVFEAADEIEMAIA